MGSSDTLKILTTVELAPLKAGMQGAASIVQGSADQMEASFKKVEAASQQLLNDKPVIVYNTAVKKVTAEMQNMVAVTKEVEKSKPFGTLSVYELNEYRGLLKQLGLDEKAIVEQQQILSKMSIKAREQEIAACEYLIKKELERAAAATAASTSATAASATNTAAMLANTTAVSNSSSMLFSSMQKGAAVSGFSWLTLGANIGKVIAPLRMVAYIMPGIGMAGMIAAFGSLLVAIIPIPDALKNIFESEEKVRQKSETLRQELEKGIDVWDKSAEKIEAIGRKSANLGLGGTAKSKAELGQLKYDIEIAKDAYSGLASYYNRLSKRAEKMFYRGGVKEFTDDAKEAQIILGQVSKETKEELLSDLSKSKQAEILDGITDVAAKTEEAERHLAELRTELALKQKEVALDVTKQTEDSTKAHADTVKRLALIEVEQRKNAAERGYKDGTLSLEQYTEALVAAENNRYKIEETAITRRAAMIRAQAARTGEEASPKLQELNVDKTALKADSDEKIRSLRISAAERTRDDIEAIEKVQAESEHKLSLDKLEAEEQIIKQRFARHEISIQKEESLLQATAQKRYETEVVLTNKLIALENKQPQVKVARVMALQAQLVSLEANHQYEVASIAAAAQDKQLEKTQENARQETDAAINEADRAYGRQTTMENQKLSARKVSTQTWYAEQVHYLDAWLESVQAALNAELAMYKEGTKEYEAILKKKKAADDKYEDNKEKVDANLVKDEDKMYNKITGLLNRNIVSVIQGQQSIGQAVKSIWNDMASNMALNVLKMIEQMIMYSLTNKAITKEGIAHDAGSAAASAYKHVMKALPFPVDMIVAPIAAAGTFASVMAFGSFDRGGVVGDDMFAQVHKREMVLDPSLSTGLQEMIMNRTGSGSGGGGNTYHLHSSPTLIGNEAWQKKTIQSMDREIGGMLRRAKNYGRLNYNDIMGG